MEEAQRLILKVEQRNGRFLRPFESGLDGSTAAAEPSRLVRGEDGYWITYCNGPGLNVLFSKDQREWHARAFVLASNPPWLRTAVPNGDDVLWSPDLTYDKARQRWIMFYAYAANGQARAFNSNGTGSGGYHPANLGNCLIGALTSRSVRLEMKWEDAGLVVQTARADGYRALDPSPIWVGGRLWLVFGGCGGIMIQELDPVAIRPVGHPIKIANSPLSNLSTPPLWHAGHYFYLFFTRGVAYNGLLSTAKVCVARSKKLLGPYMDREGREAHSGGGTVIITGKYPLVGPSGLSVGDDPSNAPFFFSLCNSTGEENALGLATLGLDRDGWPYVKGLRE